MKKIKSIAVLTASVLYMTSFSGFTVLAEELPSSNGQCGNNLY